MDKPIKISKTDAARRQLETAIKIFFTEGDSVSVHTLASASSDILKDISKKTKKKTIHTELVEVILPDKKQEVLDIVNKPKQFFKHASRDHLEILDFYPSVNEYTLFIAVQAYASLCGEVTAPMMAFRAYFYMKHFELFKKSENTEIWKHFAKSVDIQDKRQFLVLIELFEKQSS